MARENRAKIRKRGGLGIRYRAGNLAAGKHVVMKGLLSATDSLLDTEDPLTNKKGKHDQRHWGQVRGEGG